MQPGPGPDPRPLVAVAVLGLVGGCWMAGMRSTPDDQLVDLVGRLTAVQASSTAIAAAIVGASAILAAVAIPVVTVIVLLRSGRPAACRPKSKDPAPAPRSKTAPQPAIPPTADQPRLAQGAKPRTFQQRREVPDQATHHDPKGDH